MSRSVTTPTDTLVRLLEPWLNRARHCVRLLLDEFSESRDLATNLWIDWEVSAFYATTNDWMMDVEAMELLDLLVRVDYEQGWRQILALMYLEMHLPKLLELLPVRVYPRFTLVWDKAPEVQRSGSGPVSDRGWARVVERFVFQDETHAHSPAYDAVKYILEKSWLERHGSNSAEWFHRQPEDRIPLGIEAFMRVAVGASTIAKWLNELATLVFQSRNATQCDLFQKLRSDSNGDATGVPPVALSSMFELQRMLILGDRHIQMSDVMLRHMYTISCHGVHVHELTLCSRDQCYGQLSSLGTTTFIRDMLLHQPRALLPTDVLIQQNGGLRLFQGMCSALAENDTIHSARFLLLEDPSDGPSSRGQDQRCFWPWIAYSIFSTDASTSVFLVDLDVSTLTHGHVQSFERVMKANDPLAAIATSPRQHLRFEDTFDEARLVRDPMVVEIRPHTPLFVRDLDKQDGYSMISSGEGTQKLRWVDDVSTSGSNHVCVVYPGAGLAWVHADNILHRGVFSPATPVASHHFSIDFCLSGTTSLSALLVLIQLIGSRVTTLVLSAAGSTQVDGPFLQEVVAACPRLRRLDMRSVVVTSFSWLEQQRLKSMALSSVRCLDPKGYSHLMSLLGGRVNSPFGETLRELSIEDTTGQLSAIVGDIITILKTNNRLERVVLAVDPDAVEEGDDWETSLVAPGWIQQLLCHHGEALPARRAPVPLECKLAFLSMMPRSTNKFDHTSAMAATTALPELDAELVALIFGLAAPRKTRICGFVACPT